MLCFSYGQFFLASDVGTVHLFMENGVCRLRFGCEWGSLLLCGPFVSKGTDKDECA